MKSAWVAALITRMCEHWIPGHSFGGGGGLGTRLVRKSARLSSVKRAKSLWMRIVYCLTDNQGIMSLGKCPWALAIDFHEMWALSREF